MGLELARRAIDALMADPATYDPATYCTESTTDLAGRICIDAGAQPVWGSTWGGPTAHCEYGDGIWSMPELARRLTGITAGEMAALGNPRLPLEHAAMMVASLEKDRMLIAGDGLPLALAEETWTLPDGFAMIWRHRRTVLTRCTGHTHAYHFDTRAQAHDAACDTPIAQRCKYTHHRHIWENHT